MSALEVERLLHPSMSFGCHWQKDVLNLMSGHAGLDASHVSGERQQGSPHPATPGARR